MANDRPIRDLPIVSNVDNDIQFPVDQNGTAMRLYIDDLRASFIGSSNNVVVVTATLSGDSGTASMGADEVYEAASNNLPVFLLYKDANNNYVSARLANVYKSGSTNYTAMFYQDIGNTQRAVLWVLDEIKNISVSEEFDFVYSGTDTVITLNYTPQNNTDAVNKEYVDSEIDEKIDTLSNNTVVLRMEDMKVYNKLNSIKGSQINSIASSIQAVFLWDEDNQKLYVYIEPTSGGSARFCLFGGNRYELLEVDALTNSAEIVSSGNIPAKISDLENDVGRETVENYTALLESTADRVMVMDMSDSIYGFEGACEFYKSDLVWESGTKTHLSSFAHRTSDGAVMLACPDQIPTPPPNAPVSALGDCIASWVRPQTWSGHESETLTYGAKGLFYATANTYTPWDSERTYGSGEYLEHNGVVYRAKQSISGVEPPNDTYYESYLSKNLIDCSGFVSAIIQGITFQNSRYILGINAENVRGGFVGSNYMTETTYETGYNHGGMVTSQMVEWFAEQKRLFRLRTDDDDQNNQDAINQLRFGDVLFSGDPNDSRYDNRAYHIDHCMLVLKVYNDGHILVAQGGGRGTGFDGATGNFLKSSDFNGHVPTCKLSIIDMRGMIGDDKTYRVFARPNYGGLEDYHKTVPVTVNNETDSNNRIARIYCLDNLYRGESYTLILKGDLPDGDNYVLSAKLWNGGSVTGYGTVIDLPEVDFTDGVAVIPFVYPSSFSEKANELAIFATPKSGAEAQTFEITEAAIVRGFSDSAEMTKAITVPNSATVSGLLDELKTQVVDVIPSFESRRGRVQAGGQTCDWKVIRKATNTRYLIAIIGSGGSGIVRECVNGTATDTSYTAANPVPLYYVF